MYVYVYISASRTDKQLFFVAQAQNWCTVERKAAEHLQVLLSLLAQKYLIYWRSCYKRERTAAEHLRVLSSQAFLVRKYKY
jgi:hypothetical protein